MIRERWKNLLLVLKGERPVERALSVTVQKLMADLAAADKENRRLRSLLAAADKENRRLRSLLDHPWPDCCLDATDAVEKIERLEAALKVAADRLHHFGYAESAKQARAAMGYSDV